MRRNREIKHARKSVRAKGIVRGGGRSRLTVVSAKEIELIFVLLFMNYSTIFHLNNRVPAFVHSCMQRSRGDRAWLSQGPKRSSG